MWLGSNVPPHCHKVTWLGHDVPLTLNQKWHHTEQITSLLDYWKGSFVSNKMKSTLIGFFYVNNQIALKPPLTSFFPPPAKFLCTSHCECTGLFGYKCHVYTLWNQETYWKFKLLNLLRHCLFHVTVEMGLFFSKLGNFLKGQISSWY